MLTTWKELCRTAGPTVHTGPRAVLTTHGHHPTAAGQPAFLDRLQYTVHGLR